jgi:hypothetical protein
MSRAIPAPEAMYFQSSSHKDGNSGRAQMALGEDQDQGEDGREKIQR